MLVCEYDIKAVTYLLTMKAEPLLPQVKCKLLARKEEDRSSPFLRARCGCVLEELARSHGEPRRIPLDKGG